MSDIKLTQNEAERLIAMLKNALQNSISFPRRGNKIEFKVQGDTNRDLFVISIYRGKINRQKYNLGARIDKNGILLMELHVNKNDVHINPNGEKIIGSHWHFYSEEHGRRLALPVSIEDDNFVNTTIEFMNKFNVIEQPILIYQPELI